MIASRHKALFAAALGFAAFALSSPPRADQAAFSDAQKSEIETIVHAYLLAHPEVLREVSVELEKKQQAEDATQRSKAIDDNKTSLFDSQFQAVVGNPNGKVTLIEFFDYNCGYCKRALSDLVSLIKAEPDLRVVLKDFPVLGPNSVEAAQIASAARKQISGDRFFEFHQKLLLSHGPVGKDQALAVAREMGLDMDRLQKDARDPAIRSGLEDIMKIADQLNLTGTPSYVVGKEALVGAVGIDQLKGRVDAMGKCGKTVC